MRWSIAVAAGLFATNLVVYELRAPPQPPAPRLAGIVPSAKLPPDAFHISETQRLVWLHNAWRVGFHTPGCAHHDPLAILDADVDPAPGREHVVGNRQYGVAMYAQSGDLLGYMHPIGCGGEQDGDQSLSLSFNGRLIVTTHDVSFDARTYTAHIVEREGDLLVDKLALPVGYATSTSETEGKLYLRGDKIEAKIHGRTYVRGAWRAVDEHCTYSLVTRSSSCRRPAEERTSAPE
jgi:hypothetical protein